MSDSGSFQTLDSSYGVAEIGLWIFNKPVTTNDTDRYQPLIHLILFVCLTLKMLEKQPLTSSILFVLQNRWAIDFIFKSNNMQIGNSCRFKFLNIFNSTWFLLGTDLLSISSSMFASSILGEVIAS